MGTAPDPSEIYRRAVAEGERRLDQSLLELVATSFIAGFTIVFGMVALGILEAMVGPPYGGAAHVAGALAFGVGMVFLIVGRAELFSENFFDPAAKAVDADDTWMVGPVLRLWSVAFALNLVGGALMSVVFAVPGALPHGTAAALRVTAAEFVHRGHPAGFALAVAGGALVALLSFMLSAVDGVASRIGVSYAVGFLLALGPFDHVIVTVLHVLLGVLFGAEFGAVPVLAMTAVVTAGNVVGGIGLTTMTHVAQAKGARESDGGGEGTGGGGGDGEESGGSGGGGSGAEN